MLTRLHEINGLLNELDASIVAADKAAIFDKAARIKEAVGHTREILAELTGAVAHLAEEVAAIRRERK